MRLDGKVAVVTGAGSSGPGVGSGKAISVLFAREGAKVLLIDQVEERAQETLATIEQEGGSGVVFQADITEPADCEAAIAAAAKQFGPPSILVNNVGLTRHGDALDVTAEEWDFIFAVNLKSMMLMSKYALPHMIAQKSGSIINISSTGAVRPPGGHLAYDASKGGVISFTIGLAVEQGRNGVRVNCIMPGRMLTPMVDNIRKEAGVSEEEHLAVMSRNLLNAGGTAWDIANAALFLASDEARWITSVSLPVDGGFLHTPPDFQP